MLAARSQPRPARSRWLLERADELLHAMRETPVVRLEYPRLDLYAKLEFQNLVGSVKDRPAIWVLRSAIDRGEIDEATTVVESSSGNFAIALATFCRMLGLRFIPVIDPNISPLNEAALRAACDTVVRVDTRDETGGFLKTRLKKVQTLLSEIPNTFWTNQYGNTDAVIAHYRLTGMEIVRVFSHLDYAFIGVSTASTIAGVSRRLRETFPDVKVVAVDAEGSVVFGAPPRKRYIPGLGSSIVPDLLRHASIDDVVHVPEVSAVAGCRELLERHRIFAGGSSGSAYAAIGQYLPRMGNGRRRPTVLFLCADRGVPYLKTVYDRAWVKWLQMQHAV